MTEENHGAAIIRAKPNNLLDAVFIRLVINVGYKVNKNKLRSKVEIGRNWQNGRKRS